MSKTQLTGNLGDYLDKRILIINSKTSISDQYGTNKQKI